MIAPGLPPAHSGQMLSALAFQRAGRPDLAEALYRDVLRVAPTDPDALHMLGTIEYQSGRYWDAFTHIRAALDVTGWRLESMRYNLAFVLRAMQSGDETVAAVLSGDEPRRPELTRARDYLAAATRDMLGAPRSATHTEISRARVLVVDESTPRPDRNAGALRIVEIMRLLRERGCSVMFVPDHVEFESAHAQSLRRRGVEVALHPDTASVAECMANNAGSFDIVWLCGHRRAEAWLALARRCDPDALVVFDATELESLREIEAAELTGDPDAYRRASQACAQEMTVARRADTTVTVNDADAALIRARTGVDDVRMIPYVYPDAPVQFGFAERRDILFVADFGNAANVDAATWFVQDVWPIARNKLPGVRVHLVGNGTPPSVHSLAGVDIEAVGDVADLRPYLERCRLMIAPLRRGGGMAGKLGMAQSAGMPLVSTSIGVKGMNVVPDRDALVADTRDDFVDALARAYHDEALWQSLAENGRRALVANDAPGRASREIESLIAAARAQKTARERLAVSPRRKRSLVMLSSDYGCLAAEAVAQGLLDHATSFCPDVDVDLLTLHVEGRQWRWLDGAKDMLNGVPQAHPPGVWERHLGALIARYDNFVLLDVEASGNGGAQSCGVHPKRWTVKAIELGKCASVFSLGEPSAGAAIPDDGQVRLLGTIADPAFLLSEATSVFAHAEIGEWLAAVRRGDRSVVVVNVPGRVLNYRPDGGPTAIESLSRALSDLAADQRVGFLLMPYDLRPMKSGADDIAAAVRVSSRLRAMSPWVEQRLFVPTTARDAAWCAAHADLVLAGQRHLAIAALNAIVAVGLLDDGGGTADLLEAFQIEDAACNVPASSAQRLTDFARRLLRTRQTQRAQIARHLPRMREIARADVRIALARSC
jgi:glycosyltransferase involved in cell wall biosynthesis